MKRNKISALFKTKRVRYAFFLLVLAASVYVLARLYTQNMADVQMAFKQAHFLPLLFTLPIFLLSSLLTAMVWGQMMNALIGANLPIKTHIHIYLATLFAGRLPGGIWNVLGRMAWYNQLGIPQKSTLVVSALQWFMILFSGGIVVILTLPWLAIDSLKNNAFPLAAFLIALILLNPFLLNKLLRWVLRNPDLPPISYRHLLAWIGQYFVIWLLGGGILFLTVFAFYPVKIIDSPRILSAWGIGAISGSLVTFLPSGLGITELSISFILSQRIPGAIAVIVALLMRVLLTLYEFLTSGVFYLLSQNSKNSTGLGGEK